MDSSDYSSFESLPVEMVWCILVNLHPLDVIKLGMTSKKMLELVVGFFQKFGNARYQIQMLPALLSDPGVGGHDQGVLDHAMALKAALERWISRMKEYPFADISGQWNGPRPFWTVHGRQLVVPLLEQIDQLLQSGQVRVTIGYPQPLAYALLPVYADTRDWQLRFLCAQAANLKFLYGPCEWNTTVCELNYPQLIHAFFHVHKLPAQRLKWAVMSAAWGLSMRAPLLIDLRLRVDGPVVLPATIGPFTVQCVETPVAFDIILRR